MSLSADRDSTAISKSRVFSILFALAYANALLPPVYIWASGRHGVLFGLPASVWYMLGICVFATATCAALYAYESSRKEVE
jgi:hypothetical protein